MATTTHETGTKKSGRKNQVAGFRADKIDAAVMRAYVEEHGLEIDTDVTDEQLAVALTMHFRDTVGKEDLVRCEKCEGVSSAELTACPFCGDEGDVEDGDDDVAAAAVPAPESSESVIEAAPEEQDKAEIYNSEDDEDEPEVQAAPPSPKKTAAAKEKKMQNGTSTHADAGGKKSTALAKTSASGLSTRDLDKAIQEVQKLRTAGVVAYWELGRKILDINEKRLWTLRTDDKGKAKYKSFAAFVHHELNMSSTHAYNAMECAQGYKTADDVRAIGSTSKAVLLLKAAPQDREHLAEQAKAGATKGELARQVAESRKKHGSPKKDKQQAKAGAAGKAAQQQQRATRAEKVSVTSIEGSKTVKLYKRPASMRGVVIEEQPRAKRLADAPFGRVELANGVVQYISILVDKNGELVAKIETCREEE